MDYDARPVSFNVLIPQYDNLTFTTCFYDFGTGSYQCLVSNFTLISLHTLCHVALHKSFASSRQADIM
jgi:hypothetical protein